MSDEILIITVVLASSISLLAWVVIDAMAGGFEKYKTGFKRSAGARLDEMFMFLDPQRLFAINLAIILSVSVVVWIITRSWVPSAIALVVCALAPRWLWNFLRKRRMHKLEEQLPDALMAISGGLKAGVSLTSSLQQVIAESRAPFSQEFGLVLREQRLGVSLDDALSHLLRRVPTQTMILVVSAMRIALQTGGGLAETLERTSHTLRAKFQVEGKIDALTSQGRLQMWVVGLLPVGLMLILHKMEPDAMRMLWTTNVGYAVLTVIAILEFLGIYMIRKICSIDV